MGNDSGKENSGQERTKKEFILPGMPVWIDQHQDWISDGARQLYKTVRTLADVKTGRLFIPGRGWIRLQTIEKKAGMSHNTRKKYFSELKQLGAVKIEREYVFRVIGGRKRKVLGQAQITVLPLRKPHQHRVSTTDHSAQNANREPQNRVSTTDQSTTDQAENGLLQTNSSTEQELVDQFLSEPTNGAAGSGVGSVPLGSNTQCVSTSSSNLTSAEPDEDDDAHTDWKTNPDFQRWARRRILQLAKREVRNPQAYVACAMPSFLENIAGHVEQYLTDVANAYVASCMSDAPDLPIGFKEIEWYLGFVCDNREWLPTERLDDGLIRRIFAAIATRQGEGLLVCEPCGFLPSDAWRELTAKHPDWYPVRGWTPERSFIVEYAPRRFRSFLYCNSEN